jgi:hypothetical protein
VRRKPLLHCRHGVVPFRMEMEDGHPYRLESRIEEPVSALAHYAVVVCFVRFDHMSEALLW